MSDNDKLHNISILIIDDSKLTREILKAILKSFGIQDIYEAGDGLAGFEVISRHRIDLIICDVFMAPMHGLKFLEMIRAGETPPEISCKIPCNIPLIMITGKTMKSIADNPAASWDAILDKPIQPDLLLREICRLFQ
ncbi:MAG: response regulator [Rhodospirillaceae bacterium]